MYSWPFQNTPYSQLQISLAFQFNWTKKKIKHSPRRVFFWFWFCKKTLNRVGCWTISHIRHIKLNEITSSDCDRHVWCLNWKLGYILYILGQQSYNCKMRHVFIPRPQPKLGCVFFGHPSYIWILVMILMGHIFVGFIQENIL